MIAVWIGVAVGCFAAGYYTGAVIMYDDPMEFFTDGFKKGYRKALADMRSGEGNDELL